MIDRIVHFLRSERFRVFASESWKVCWPMTLIMMFMSVVGLSDIYVAGWFGKETQAAYGLAFQLFFIFGIIGQAISVGLVAVASRQFSAGKERELRESIDSGLVIAIATGLTLGVLGLLCSGWLVYSLNVPASLKGQAHAIVSIYCVGMPFSYILINTNAVLRACQRITISLWTMFVVCVLNVILNFALGLHTPLGYRGIAVATLISTGIGCVINYAAVRRFVAGKVLFSRRAAGRIFAIGWPSGLLQVFFQFGAMVLFIILGSLPEKSVETLAAFTNGLRIESMIFLPVFAFNMANAVVVGNLLGKKEKHQAFLGGIVTALMGVVVAVAMTLIVIANARLFAGFLSRNETVIRTTMTYLYISMLFEPVMAWSVILGGGLNGAGDTKSVMLAMACSTWLVRVPLAYLLGVHYSLGAAAVWWSMNVSILVQSLLITRRYFSRRWIDEADEGKIDRGSGGILEGG
ncbi:MAG TPA: MATE family efflux transporter [Candidatus Omnitrophota bacterium]|nr:MATE family efflux transporter [Candidatus Omnitrophota bacterium]HRZ14367.1 MATE family efflux transporter [Candidatus Omnitrophota bacterium]